MDALSGQPIVDRGTPEEGWQQSGFLDTLPVIALQDLLGKNCARVVVVSPHPDDEVLGCGGLLSVCAARHIPLQVLSVSDGENCYPDDPSWPPDRLRIARSRELADALAKLGIAGDSCTRLRIPDGEVAANEADLVQLLELALFPDDVVLVPWRRDGHPDHEATSRACQVAANARGCRVLEFPIWAWHWMSSDGAEFGDSGISRFLLSDSTQQLKQQAIGCFTTQIAPGQSVREPILPAHVLSRFARSCEVYLHD